MRARARARLRARVGFRIACLVMNICWKLESDERMEPPGQG